MSSIAFEKHHVIELKPSKVLLMMSSVTHLLAVVVISSLSIELLVKLVFVLVVGANFVLFLHKYGWISQIRVATTQSITHIRYQDDNHWQLQNRAGGLIAANLKGSSFSGLNMLVLIFKINDVHWLRQRLSLVIIKDSIDPLSFRHLRIHLRLMVHPT